MYKRQLISLKLRDGNEEYYVGDIPLFRKIFISWIQADNEKKMCIRDRFMGELQTSSFFSPIIPVGSGFITISLCSGRGI